MKMMTGSYNDERIDFNVTAVVKIIAFSHNHVQWHSNEEYVVYLTDGTRVGITAKQRQELLGIETNET